MGAGRCREDTGAKPEELRGRSRTKRVEREHAAFPPTTKRRSPGPSRRRQETAARAKRSRFLINTRRRAEGDGKAHAPVRAAAGEVPGAAPNHERRAGGPGSSRPHRGSPRAVVRSKEENRASREPLKLSGFAKRNRDSRHAGRGTCLPMIKASI